VDIFQRWPGKIIAVEKDERRVQVQWLWRPKDLSTQQRTLYKLNPHELLMTSEAKQRQWLDIDVVERIITVSEGRPSSHSEYYWARLWFPSREFITEPCRQ
jgi:hypothetical protein